MFLASWKVYYEQRSSTPSTRGFYTGDSSYSIAWLRLGGNRSAADAQFDQGLRHIDLAAVEPVEDEKAESDSSQAWEGFGVWKETLDGGNKNFLTGVGGWLQNIIYGYAGLRYTERGTLQVSHPLLPPGGVTTVTLRGVSLGLGADQRRFSLRFNASTATFFVPHAERCPSSTPSLVVKDNGGEVHELSPGDSPLVLPVNQEFDVALKGGS